MKNPKSNRTLWYDKPANAWEEALPLGNGRIGAMVYGGIARERIGLNEDTLWSGYPRDTNVADGSAYFPQAAALAMAGQYHSAQEHIEAHMLGGYTQSYLPIGDLLLDFPGLPEESISGYRRVLDLQTALSTVEFDCDGVTYRRECFVSAPGQALVLRLTASKPGMLHVGVSLDSQLRHRVEGQGNRLLLKGICPAQADPDYLFAEKPIAYGETPETQGMSFITVVKLAHEGGTVAPEDGKITVTGADGITIYLCAQTSFNGFDKHPQLAGKDYQALCQRDMEAVEASAYEELKAAHVQDYQALFNRVEISLGEEIFDLPTDERLRQAGEADTALFALMFQYGRYLTIAGSRAGTMATNLQGIWNAKLRAPWSSNYTVNINTEMNYWPTEACGLPELHRPLFALLERTAVTGAKTAKLHYQANGFVLHHNTDIWGLANPVGNKCVGTATYAFWPMAAGWLSRHVFEHYEYSLDKDFLRETAFPLIRGAAEFYLSVLQEEEKGDLIFCPSTSPENRFVIDGKPCAVSKTTTMTTAILRETLQNLVACCEILEIEPLLKKKAQAALNRLPNYEIGSRGELLEWNQDFMEEDIHHRHVSHLYPLYPATEIDPEYTPELAQACRKTLELRGDESTGWAMAWRICLWARLGDGNHAYQVLRRQLNFVEAEGVNYSGGGGSYANLFGAHPPFQIDSNFGTTAGICEMLLQNRPEGLRLLPALPEAFQKGHIKGLRAKGGLTVDISFQKGELLEAVLHKTQGGEGTFVVFYKGKSCTVHIKPGESKVLTERDFKTTPFSAISP